MGFMVNEGLYSAAEGLTVLDLWKGKIGARREIVDTSKHNGSNSLAGSHYIVTIYPNRGSSL